MNLSSSRTHSFIVRIWREEDNGFTWRGHITHVPSGEKKYFEDMACIVAFIRPYLEIRDVKVGLKQRVKQWLKRRKSKQRGGGAHK